MPLRVRGLVLLHRRRGLAQTAASHSPQLVAWVCSFPVARVVVTVLVVRGSTEMAGGNQVWVIKKLCFDEKAYVIEYIINNKRSLTLALVV